MMLAEVGFAEIANDFPEARFWIVSGLQTILEIGG
jgi:hypothetical protein